MLALCSVPANAMEAFLSAMDEPFEGGVPGYLTGQFGVQSARCGYNTRQFAVYEITHRLINIIADLLRTLYSLKNQPHFRIGKGRSSAKRQKKSRENFTPSTSIKPRVFVHSLRSVTSLVISPAMHPSIWRSLHHSAKRRTVAPPTPYRCFSCSLRAQDQSKPDQEGRTTHFGFTNVPETQKESMGMGLDGTGRTRRTELS